MKKTIGIAAAAVVAACVTTAAMAQEAPAPAAPAGAKAKPAARSSLPTEALEKARQAEQALAANQPEEAITILQGLDKQHSDNPAISLRLAEIHDTLSRYGYALFYYRRYVSLAGPNAREMAAARVQTLELMAGIDDDAAAAAKALGQQTVPVATPTPKVQRMIAAEAKDGRLVPLRSEEDLKNIRALTAKAAASPAVTPTNSPIVIPESLTATPTATAAAPTPAGQSAGMPISGSNAVPDTAPAPRGDVTRERKPANVQGAAKPNVTVHASATPPPPDQDALLAKAFVKSDSPETIRIEEKPKGTSAPETKSESTKNSSKSETKPAEPAEARGNVPAEPTAVPSLGEAVAFTKATPVSDSPRGANFFHQSKSNSSYAQVVMLNDLPQGVVTLSIVPPDDREVLSAILLPGESKTLYVPPGRYSVTANASTTDYSPITLMSTQFQYSFQGGKQYTRRVTQESLQRVN